MSNTFEQGWSARPFKEQFPELSDREAERLDCLNLAITDMVMADLLTFSQSENIRSKRFPKVVSAAVMKARARAAEPAKEKNHE